jgi:hypothetical protein
MDVRKWETLIASSFTQPVRVLSNAVRLPCCAAPRAPAVSGWAKLNHELSPQFYARLNL